MFRVEANEPGHRFVASGDTAIVVWLRTPTVAAARRMFPFLSSVSGECGGSICVLAIIEPSAALPDPATRAVMAEAMAKTASLTKRIATIIDGEGFRASAMRSVASGLQLLARKTAPMKNFRSVEAAVPWLCEDAKGGGAERIKELNRAVLFARTGQ